MLKTAALCTIVVATNACAVKSVYVRPEFATQDKHTLKRIGVFATPLAGKSKAASRLLARVARRYVHLRKDYLVMTDDAIAADQPLDAICSAAHLDGVLTLRVSRLQPEDDELEVAMTADLRRCDSHADVWRVEVDDSVETQDDDLKGLITAYRGEFGDVADEFAAPFFVVAKAGLESLPSPTLTDEETMEKIESEDDS